MLTIKRIVCPIDFSPCSDQAVHVAMDVAARFGARVELLHVLQTSAYVVPLMPMGGAPLDFMQELPARMERQLAHLRDQLEAKHPTVPVSVSLHDGGIDTVIIERAKEIDADLIVIGTHGHTGLAHVLLGSIAERVVRTAACPVLTVGPGQLGASDVVPMTRQRVLCAIDFSEPSLHALDHAAAFAHALNADLHILHVVTLLGYAVASRDPVDTADYEAHVREEIKERLDALKAKYSDDSMRVEITSLDGVPFEGIARVAEQVGASFIAVGTHGYTGIHRLLLGSVAEKVVRTAHVPVLTVRLSEADQATTST